MFAEHAAEHIQTPVFAMQSVYVLCMHRFSARLPVQLQKLAACLVVLFKIHELQSL